jgi:hypothetical protein
MNNNIDDDNSKSSDKIKEKTWYTSWKPTCDQIPYAIPSSVEIKLKTKLEPSC